MRASGIACRLRAPFIQTRGMDASFRAARKPFDSLALRNDLDNQWSILQLLQRKVQLTHSHLVEPDYLHLVPVVHACVLDYDSTIRSVFFFKSIGIFMPCY